MAQRTRPGERRYRDGAAKARALQALELHIEGKSYDEIARLAGYKSRSGAWDAVNAELEKVRAEKREQAFAVDNTRLTRLLETFYPQARTGDSQAAAVCIRLLERRAKMFGYDQDKGDATVNAGQVVVLDIVREAAAVSEVAS